MDTCKRLAECILAGRIGYGQELLQEESLKVIDQCNPNVYRSAMLQHILPEGEVRQKGEKMALEVGTKEVLCLQIGLHIGVVGEGQDER